MDPPSSLQRHPCSEIIEELRKCHSDHPIKKVFGECSELNMEFDRCIRQEIEVRRKANFEDSKKRKERLRAHRKEEAKRRQDETVSSRE